MTYSPQYLENVEKAVRIDERKEIAAKLRACAPGSGPWFMDSEIWDLIEKLEANE